jgi:4-oxalomesaconate hydratase
MSSAQEHTGLAVSAHAAHFIWRAGGAIALYAKRGWRIKVVCLSFRERGESPMLWKYPAMMRPKLEELRLTHRENLDDVPQDQL